MNYLLYDEIDIYIEGDMEIDQEVLIGSVYELSVSRGRLSDTERVLPIYDTTGVTEEEYADFWDYVHESARSWEDFLNLKVLSTGIPLPYWNLEFLSKFTFHPHAMLVVMDVFYSNMDTFGESGDEPAE